MGRLLKVMGLTGTMALLSFSGLAWSAPDHSLGQQLASNFPTQSPVYIGYERVGPQNTAHDQQQYLVLDFRFVNKPNRHRVQQAVAQICHSILHNYGLLQQLDNQGYNEISVAFDRQYQYDCL